MGRVRRGRSGQGSGRRRPGDRRQQDRPHLRRGGGVPEMSTIQKGIDDGPAMSSRVVKAVVLLVCCAVVVVPFLGVISTSIASQEHVTNSGGFVLWPDGLNWDAYKAIFNGGVVQRALGVSVLIAVGGTLISLAGSTMLAYAL